MRVSTITFSLTVSITAISTAEAADITLRALYQVDHPIIYEPMAGAFTAPQHAIDVELIPGSGNYEGIMHLGGRRMGQVPVSRLCRHWSTPPRPSGGRLAAKRCGSG